MTDKHLTPRSTAISSHVSTPRLESKPDSVNAVAVKYLCELLTGVSIKRSDLQVEHVCQKAKSTPLEHVSAAEYLAAVTRELALPELPSECIEITDEPLVVLALGARYFHGFLNGKGGTRVVFGFDHRLAQELSVEAASKLQPALALLGYTTTQIASSRAKASF
jgi:hypothetical protein